MSVQLNSLNVRPLSVKSVDGETEIKLTWNAIITQASDNPVKVRLQIDPASDISFISTQNNEESEVEWEQNFEVGNNKNYSETVVVKVINPQQLAQTAIIKMTLTGAAGGVPSTLPVKLMYK